jgi:pimeloyl-ACP methyl ester carboxylesterase
MRGIRIWFRLASIVAPRVAERQAAAMFLTPQRRPAAHRRRHPRGARPVLMTGDGLGLQGWEWGLGAKPIALLVHGWGGLASDMTAIAEALLEGGRRVLAFDMPGHGRSPGRRTSLVEWVRALGAIERWAGGIDAVVGHSFGTAALALALEEQMQARRAVLLAPSPGPMDALDQARRFMGLPEARVPGMIARLRAVVGHDMPHFEPARAARSIRVPALILHDPADSEVPFEAVERLADAWRGSRLELLTGVGHYRILRDPAVAARAGGFVADESEQPEARRAPQSAMSGR